MARVKYDKIIDPNTKWVEPPDFGPPGTDDPPLELNELDLSEVPPVNQGPQETDMIFGPSEDVATPPGAGEVSFAPDLPSSVRITQIERPLFGSAPEQPRPPDPPIPPEPTPPEPEPTPPEPETITIGKEQDEAPAKGPGVAYVNGHDQTTQINTETLNRVLALAEAAVLQKSPLAQQPQVIQMQTPITPEQGAHAVLTLVDERHQMTLQQIAIEQAQGSLAAVIAGLITRIADLEDLREFALNESWMNAIHQPTTTGAQPTGLPLSSVQPHRNICEYCQHPFKPTFQSNRQRFCCNACGNLALGYSNEPLPHRADCTTEPGKELAKIMKASKPQAEAA